MDTIIELPNDECKLAVNEIIEKHLGTSDYTLITSKGSSVGDNYIGIIYRVLATRSSKINRNDATNKNGVVDDGNINDNNNNSISLIIKLPPDNLARREQFFARPCFLRESWIYDEVLPMFEEFQKSNGILCNENGFNEIPKCYRTITEEFKEGLYFEDLKVSGYEMFDRLTDITVDHAILVMKVLGKFHALSFALRDKKPDEFEKFKSIEDIFVIGRMDKIMEDHCNTLVKKFIKTLDAKTDAGIIEKMNNLLGDGFMNVFLNCVNGKSSEPYSILCHGDCWNNNVLFKYNKEGIPIDIRLLDWQVARYASPVCDLTYYIFCCTTKEFRDKYYDTLINTYYKSLSDLLKRMGCDPTKLFSYTALQEQLKAFGKFGLVMATMVLPIFTSHKDDIPDLDDIALRLQNGESIEEEFGSKKSNDVVFNKRMKDVAIDMINLGYI